MIQTQQFEAVAQRLGDDIEHAELLKETSLSKLYLLEGRQKYVLKENKCGNIRTEYDNHLRVFEIWSRHKEAAEFYVPKTYFLNEDESFYVMEYIAEAIELRETLPKQAEKALDSYDRTGRCLRQYHEIMTEEIVDNRMDIENHPILAKLLAGKNGKHMQKILSEFGEECYQIILKDFTFSNVMVDTKGKLYFFDFQKIEYYAPFYYDLARFIDTLKVFTFLEHPIFAIRRWPLIKKATKRFIEGYGKPVDQKLLRSMQLFHRKEHVFEKYRNAPLKAMILKFLYIFM